MLYQKTRKIKFRIPLIILVCVSILLDIVLVIYPRIRNLQILEYSYYMNTVFSIICSVLCVVVQVIFLLYLITLYKYKESTIIVAIMSIAHILGFSVILVYAVIINVGRYMYVGGILARVIMLAIAIALMVVVFINTLKGLPYKFLNFIALGVGCLVSVGASGYLAYRCMIISLVFAASLIWFLIANTTAPLLPQKSLKSHEKQLKRLKTQYDAGIISDDEYTRLKSVVVNHLMNKPNELPVEAEEPSEPSENKNASQKKKTVIILIICIISAILIIGTIILVVRNSNKKQSILSEISYNESRIRQIEKDVERFEEKEDAYNKFVRAYYAYDEDDKWSVEDIYDAASEASYEFNISGAALANLTGDYDDFYKDLREAYTKELEKITKLMEEKVELTGENITLEMQLR